MSDTATTPRKRPPLPVAVAPAGRKPAFCAGQMGHSIEMFLRVYAKWIKTDQDQLEVEAFDRWLTRPLPGTGAGGQSS